jgi:hypothetical protein
MCISLDYSIRPQANGEGRYNVSIVSPLLARFGKEKPSEKGSSLMFWGPICYKPDVISSPS